MLYSLYKGFVFLLQVLCGQDAHDETHFLHPPFEARETLRIPIPQEKRKIHTINNRRCPT